MSDDERPGPDPAQTAGLESGGGVLPGDTPPIEDSMSSTSPQERDAPNMGPVSGNRTPMFIALAVLGVVVVMVAVLVVASFVAS